MLIFGHIGVTLGIARLVAICTERLPSTKQERVSPRRLSQGAEADPPSPAHKASLLPLSGWLDYRLVAVAGLFPDFIDKPLGLVFLRSAIGSGRIFAHSLLFVIVIGLAGLYLFRRQGRSWLFILAVGSLAHLMEDALWSSPKILFWPFLGTHYVPVDIWLAPILYALFHNPLVYGSEAIGFLVLVYLGIGVLRRKRFGEFLKTGLIP